MSADALRCADSVLVVIDPQERLTPAIAGADRAVANISRLIRAARRLDAPVRATEQYPQGLGLLIPEVLGLIAREETFEKTSFDATGAPAFLAAMDALARPRPVLCGFEIHVCVAQTAMGLRAAGYAPVVVEDACGARDPAQIAMARRRLAALGVPFLSTEMVMFEWLERAATGAFRDLLPLLR